MIEGTSPKIHSIKYNAFMSFILGSSSLLFQLITIPYVSRTILTYGTGAVAFAQSFESYFSLIAMLGISIYGVRECALVRDDRDSLSTTTQELLSILVISTSIIFVCYLIIIFSFVRFSDNISLFIIFGASIWLSSIGVEWFYQSIEQYDYITVRNLCFKLIGLVLTFALVHGPEDYVIYGSICVFSGFGSNVLNILRLRKYVDFDFSKKLNVRRHIKPIASFFLSSVTSGMYTQADVVMLGFLSTNTMVGMYQLASKLETMCVSGVNSVGNVLLPRLSYYRSSNDDAAYLNLLKKSASFTTISAIAFTCICFLCSDSIVLIFGGLDFMQSAETLRLISPAITLSACNIMVSQVLISSGQETSYARINTIGLIVALLFTFLLIPPLGANGAAISMVICESIVLILRLICTKDVFSKIWDYRNVAKIGFSGLISYAVSEILKLSIDVNEYITLLLLGSVFIITFLISLLLFKESFISSELHQYIHSYVNKPR